MPQPIISLLMPTRGRPALAERFIESLTAQTIHPEQVELIVYVDDDDVESHTLGSGAPVPMTRIIGPRTTMGGYNSACYRAAKGDIIILVNDDMVIRTRGWEERIIALDAGVADRIYLAYGNDLFKKRNVCTFPILSRRVCELLVEPYPMDYRGAFIDYHLFDIFKRLQHAGYDRIHYLGDVVFEHLHYRTGKAPFDETYAARSRFGDDTTFLALVDTRRLAARRLAQALRGEPAPAYVPAAAPGASAPDGLFNAIIYFLRALLLDTELPARWRIYLWVWFTGRYLAAHGWLKPFVRIG
jgi:glycosyltransferase involved in cell wall biosynthesis